MDMISSDLTVNLLTSKTWAKRPFSQEGDPSEGAQAAGYFRGSKTLSSGFQSELEVEVQI